MKTLNLIISILTGILIGILLSVGFQFKLILNKEKTLDRFKDRLDVCFKYRSQDGDYVFRHDFCRDAEKEYLELLNSLTPTKKD